MHIKAGLDVSTTPLGAVQARVTCKGRDTPEGERESHVNTPVRPGDVLTPMHAADPASVLDIVDARSKTSGGAAEAQKGTRLPTL